MWQSSCASRFGTCSACEVRDHRDRFRAESACRAWSDCWVLREARRTFESAAAREKGIEMNAFHRARVGALLVAFAAGAGAAVAQTTPTATGECHAIADNMERLACYDRVSGRTSGAPKEAAPAALPAAAGSAAGTTRTEGEAPPPVAKASMLDEAWDFDPSSPRYDIRFYNANYLLFGRYTDSVNTAPYLPLAAALNQPEPDLNSTEAKFQFSFKGRLWTTDDRRWGVWAAYTQQNQWQVYNGDESRPFRETNYMPELFVSFRPDVDLGGGFRWGLFNAGYNHQSNGRTDTLSRSWDRLFAEFGVERDSFALSAKFWYRLPENSDRRRQSGHHRLLRSRRDRRAVPVARQQLFGGGAGQREHGKGRGTACLDVAADPWSASRLRSILLGLRGELDRLQLEADHDRCRRRAERRPIALHLCVGASGARPRACPGTIEADARRALGAHLYGVIAAGCP